jgi:CDGSH-type Zn-finger protein
MTVRIRPTAGGPIVVELRAACEVLRRDGSVVDVTGLSRVLLCACGRSSSAPMCDGSHHRCRQGDSDVAPPPGTDRDAPR